MFTVIQRKSIASDISLLEVFAPRIASAILPGQYVMVKPTAKSREVVLPVYGWNEDAKTVTVLVHVTDAATEMLAHNQEISVFADMRGPLGKPSDLTECNDRELIQSRMLFVADGCASASALAQLTWLHRIGCQADVLVSAKNKNELLFISELEKVSRNVYLATDDGSVGFHGPAAQLLAILLNKNDQGYDLVMAVGTLGMMKAVSNAMQGHGILTITNFIHLLSDNTALNAGFRLSVDGQMKEVATDGPEFYGSLVDFEQAHSRLSISLKVSGDEVKSSESAAKVHEMNKNQADRPIHKQA